MKNKKLLKVLAVSLTFSISSLNINSALAAKISPYLGGGYEFSKLKFNSPDDERNFNDIFNNANIFVGAIEQETKIGIELGYSKSIDSEKNGTYVYSGTTYSTKSKSNINKFNLNIIYNPKITDKLNAIALAGVTRTDAEYKITFSNNGSYVGSGTVKGDSFGGEIGGGVEANLIGGLSARAIIKYNHFLDKKEIYAENLISANIGLKYQF